MVGIEINNATFDAAFKGLKGMNAQVKKALFEAVTSSVLDIQTKAKTAGYAPYKTGTLRRSITNKVVSVTDGVVGYVGSNLVYARIQEYGGETGRNKRTIIKGKHYLSRAVRDNKDNVQKKFERFLKVSNLLK